LVRSQIDDPECDAFRDAARFPIHRLHLNEVAFFGGD
jgi:hypothetical protein